MLRSGVIKLQDHEKPEVPPLERGWYYTVEVEPGVWTPGKSFPNIHIVRQALSRVQVEGMSCLDIGSMEGLFSIILCRRGARYVMAYDRMVFGRKISFLQEKLAVDFNLLSGFSLSELDKELCDRYDESGAMFDVVLFSGVLYHMIDPLGGLLHARRNLKNGGIMVFETAAILSSEQTAHLNAEGRFYPGDNYWLFSLGCLDTLLRFARLAPLDAFYFKHDPLPGQPQRIRVCIVCRAAESAPRADGDDWLRREQAKDFNEYIDWQRNKAYARTSPVEYNSAGRNPALTPFGTCDVSATVLGSEPMPLVRKRDAHLGLNDKN